MIERRRLLGVLDCAAPLAGAAFMERFCAAAGRRAVGAGPAVLWSEAVPLEHDDAAQAPAPAAVLMALHALERLGVDAVAMPGAAGHAWYRDLCAAAHVPVMHIVECAAADLRRARPAGSRVGVLAAAASDGAGMYRARLRQLAYDVIETPEPVAAAMAGAAGLISRGDAAGAAALVRACVRDMAGAGVSAVVLVCADVLCAARGPLAGAAGAGGGSRGGAREPLVIDPLGSLARVAASWCRGGCDAWDLVVDIPAEEPEAAAAPPA